MIRHSFADLLETVQSGARVERLNEHLLDVDPEVTPVDLDQAPPGRGSDPDVNYKPFPSASWTLHLKSREEPESDGLAKVWNFLDPGIGFNGAALDFEDESVQVGSAPTSAFSTAW